MDLFSKVRGPIPLRRNSDEDLHHKNVKGIDVGIAGDIWSVSPNLNLPKGYDQFSLKTKFDYSMNDNDVHEYREFSRVGLWVPIVDQSIPNIWGDYLHPVNEQTELWVNVEEWDFGREAELKLRRSGKIDSAITLDLCLWAVPFFNAGRGPKKCEMRVELKGFNPIEQRWEKIDDNHIKFELQEDTPRHDSYFPMNIWSEWGVFKNNGTGNSVHPKQIMTLKCLEHGIDNKFKDKSGITVAYIGSDTTENLRSVMRFLQHLEPSKIEKLTVYHTEGWDAPILKQIKGIHPLNDTMDLKNLKFELKKLTDADDGSDVESHDITICTYVTPWIQDADIPKHKARIDRLLNGKNSILLAIDPKSSDSLVRSPTSQRINVQETYVKHLKLRSNTVPNANCMVSDGVIWTK